MARLTDAQLAQALKDARGMVAVAARKLGCARATIYNRMDKSDDLREVLDEARDYTTDVAELKLFEAIQAGEGWAVKYYLSTQGKSRGYVERQEQVVTGEDGGPVEVAVTRKVVRVDGDSRA